MERRELIIAAALVAGAIGVGLWFGRPTPPPPLVIGDDADPSAATALTVHVTGWVVEPGLVTIATGSRLADAIAAAGGARAGAALDSVNLAQLLTDGERVMVPGPGDSLELAPEGKIRLNSATAAELEELPGVGPVLAAAIVAYREQHGPFKTVEDLLDVTGVGEAKLAAMRDRVSVP